MTAPTYTANPVLSGILQIPLLWKVSLSPTFSAQTSTSLVVKVRQRTFNGTCGPLPITFLYHSGLGAQGWTRAFVFSEYPQNSRVPPKQQSRRLCPSSYLRGWHSRIPGAWKFEVSLGNIERFPMMEVERRRERTGSLIIPALRRLRQEEISLSCVLRRCLRKQETNNQKSKPKENQPPTKTKPNLTRYYVRMCEKVLHVGYTRSLNSFPPTP